MKKSSFLERIGLRTVRELIGVDIGSSSIKICVLERRRKGFNLKRMAKKDYDRELLNEGVIVDEAYLAEEIKRLMRLEDVKGRDASCALSSYATMIKKISIPAVGEEDLPAVIDAEVQTQIPLPVKDIFYSYDVLGPEAEREGFMEVIIVAARKEIVEGYMNTFERAGLNLRILDVDIISVANVVAEIYEPKGTVVVVDIGASFTNIAILKGSKIEFTREIAMGGKYLTGQIAKTFKISQSEAEKKKIGSDPETAYLFEDYIFNITGEVTKTIRFYKSVKASEIIEKVYLTGGSSLLPGLKERLGEETELSVEIINPFLLLGKDYKLDHTLEEYAVFMPVALQLSSRVRDLQ
ncbi:MAG: pilus assembly protein PilM [Desulfobacterota bacterium]|nr:pilus assembly protein PilM [Thermodesulfobacteriota bacterium]